jgi:hypothetical protein
MKNCEKSFDLICNFWSSGANYGTGKNKDIMLDKKKIQELIKQGALHKNDGDQFNDQVEEKE